MKNEKSSDKRENMENGAPLDSSLMCKAVESVLKLIVECTTEKDSTIQVERARAVGILTDALTKFDFKINI